MTYPDTRSQDASSAGPATSASRAERGDHQTQEHPHADAVRQRAQRTVERVTADARHQATETVTVQKRAAADYISGLASALRDTAEQLQEQGQDGLARYTDYCADDVDRMAAWLRDSDTDTLIRQAQAFARRRPAVFLGGTVAAGFLLARFLKSSGQRTVSGNARESSAVAGSSPAPAAAGMTSGAPAHSAGPTATTDTV